MRGVTLKMKYPNSWELFQLTRLMRGVTPEGHPFNIMPLFQLTRLMRGVTFSTLVSFLSYKISTHTPHARRDLLISVRG